MSNLPIAAQTAQHKQLEPMAIPTDAQKLATAIAESATRAGITNCREHSFSGPQLLLLLDNLVELALSNNRPQPAPEIPAHLDVRKILLAITPGEGSGLEVYAQDVDDVVKTLTDLSERLELATAIAACKPAPAVVAHPPASAYESLIQDMTTIAAKEVPNGCAVSDFARHALADAELREHDAPQPAQRPVA
jgi:hypothetical protein